MSSIWYEYLEETGGEIIPLNCFKHVCRSLLPYNEPVDQTNETISSDSIIFAINYSGDKWWPIRITDYLSEGWIKFDYYGMSGSNGETWVDVREERRIVRSIRWCLDTGRRFEAPGEAIDARLEEVLEENRMREDASMTGGVTNRSCVYQAIKVGAYLECWLDNTVGFVWPVKVLSNIGGRLRLVWFGCDLSPKQNSAASVNPNTFLMFYLDHRLHSLGWARQHGWKYSPPLNIGINISISNVDTFVRGSPSAFSAEFGCDREIKEHFFEEGWQVETVSPVDPSRIHAATVRYVLDKEYFLVELNRENEEENSEPMMFAGFGGMAEILPANTSSISGYSVRGLRENSWEAHLMSVNPQRYAPHLGYFSNGGGIEWCHNQTESVFLPGCKLEAVNPWNKQLIHAGTITRSMEGSRLVWISLDSEPDVPDFLVDPYTSTEIFPVGWCEMIGHPLVMPGSYLVQNPSINISPFDSDDITIYLHPGCYLGPFLSRSAATEILPRFIGPGHCLPVFRELFHLLIKVSHKPYKLMRLLQLDQSEDIHELMATIIVPGPKSEWGNRNKRSTWQVEVAVRKRGIYEFCRQTALSLGSCPSFISTSPTQNCHLNCEARMNAKAGEKMSHQRRKRLFSRPLMSLGISYRELKSRVVGGTSNSSSNSEMDSSDREEQPPDQPSKPTESRMCTRGMRLVVSDSRRRSSKRRPLPTNLKFVKSAKCETIRVEEDEEIGCGEIFRREQKGRETIDNSVIDVRDFVIDPTFLAGDIERVTLSSNPLTWTVEQLADYLSGTDCRQLTSWLANEKVDGRAFLLLTLPVLSTLCGLQLEVAIRLCRHVVSLKRVFVEQFADMQELLPDDI